MRLDPSLGPSPLRTPVTHFSRPAPHARRRASYFPSLLLTSIAARAQDETLPAFKQGDSIEARVQGCVTCHGRSGQGSRNGVYPRIAGKPAGYLYNQLAAFGTARAATRR